MPKIISITIAAFTALILFTKSTSAQAITILQNLENPEDLSCFIVLISNIKNYALMIAGPITVLMIIIGGVMITVSGGQENLRAQGKKTLTGGKGFPLFYFLRVASKTAAASAMILLTFLSTSSSVRVLS